MISFTDYNRIDAEAYQFFNKKVILQLYME